MARKKPAKKAKAKSARKTTARKARKKAGPKKAARRTAKASKKATRKTARKAAKKTARKAAKPAARKAAKPAKKRKVVAAAVKAVASVPVASGTAHSGKKRPNLDRPRKTVADVHGIPSSLDMGRAASAAKSGRAELKERLSRNTSVSPALTAGDVDADWESAESAGDEAPGGDNTTPDQDVVDDIGRALGVEYEDDEELQGGAEIADRDRNRWELDPSSKDDFEEES